MSQGKAAAARLRQTACMEDLDYRSGRNFDRRLMLRMAACEGEKRVLALTESETENAAAIEGLLRNLLQRGFRHTKRLRIIIDGAKGIAKGAREVFGDTALIQRCQWHKRENVARKTRNKTAAEQVRTRMNEAYAAPPMRRPSVRCTSWSKTWKPKTITRAAASLREGLEEPLTLHRLDVQAPLRDSLRTTKHHRVRQQPDRAPCAQRQTMEQHRPAILMVGVHLHGDRTTAYPHTPRRSVAETGDQARWKTRAQECYIVSSSSTPTGVGQLTMRRPHPSEASRSKLCRLDIPASATRTTFPIRKCAWRRAAAFPCRVHRNGARVVFHDSLCTGNEQRNP